MRKGWSAKFEACMAAMQTKLDAMDQARKDAARDAADATAQLIAARTMYNCACSD